MSDQQLLGSIDTFAMQIEHGQGDPREWATQIREKCRIGLVEQPTAQSDATAGLVEVAKHAQAWLNLEDRLLSGEVDDLVATDAEIDIKAKLRLALREAADALAAQPAEAGDCLCGDGHSATWHKTGHCEAICQTCQEPCRCVEYRPRKEP